MGRSVIGIVGAAVSGPVLALQILSHPILSKRFRPILFDQISAPQGSNKSDTHSDSGKIVHTAGAGVGLFPNGLFPLYDLGLKDSLHAISCEMQRLSIWRGNLQGHHQFYNTSVDAAWAADLRTCPRIFERQRLQNLLLTRVRELGGQICWGKKIQSIDNVRDSGHGSKVHFTDGESTELDLLIGADGAWSAVRKYILNQRDPKSGQKRWVPEFTGIAGLYGISSSLDVPPNSDPSTLGDLREAYMVLLDRGHIGALPLEDGKVAWTIQHPELKAPERSTPIEYQDKEPESGLYESKMVPGVYSPSSTAEILRRHENIWHPTLGSFKPMFEAAERIIRSPLRLSVWEPQEIQWGNAAVIGDAARVLPPYAGQGEFNKIGGLGVCAAASDIPLFSGAFFGVEDATVLANALLNNPPPMNDPGSFQAALTEYAHTRVPRSKKVAKMASWTGVLSMGSNSWWRWIRDLGSRLPSGGDPKM